MINAVCPFGDQYQRRYCKEDDDIARRDEGIVAGILKNKKQEERGKGWNANVLDPAPKEHGWEVRARELHTVTEYIDCQGSHAKREHSRTARRSITPGIQAKKGWKDPKKENQIGQGVRIEHAR